MDGFEIAPATASKLNKWKYTPSPEKKVMALPDVGDGMIDLTDSPAKGSVETGRKGIVEERPAVKKRKESDGKTESESDVFSSSTPSTSKIATPVVRETADSDRTLVMDVDAAEGKEEKPEEVEKPVVEETPLSAEQKKVLDMVMAG